MSNNCGTIEIPSFFLVSHFKADKLSNNRSTTSLPLISLISFASAIIFASSEKASALVIT